MADELKMARRELAKTVNSFISTLENSITDSEGLERETIFISGVTVADITHGKKELETRVDPNPFNATIVVLQGSVKIIFDTGESELINEKNRCLYVPKSTGFTVIADSVKNSIITIVDKL